MDGVKFGTGLEEADTTVPAKDAVVIACGTEFFCFGKTAQGFFDEGKKDVRGTAGVKLGFGAALVEQAGIIIAFVGIAERPEDGLDFGVAISRTAGELVGDGQTQHAESELVICVNDQDIAANGFGFFGLVEVAVKLDFGKSLGDAGFGDGF